MPQNITDVATWTTPLVVPSNGDAVDGDGWETHGQGVGNRTAYLRQGTPGRAASYVWRCLPQVAVANISDRFEYLSGINVGFSGWQQINVSDAGGVYLPLDNLPIVGKISKVGALVIFSGGTGSGQHAASLPATKPKLAYYEDNLVDLDCANHLESPEVTDTTTPLASYLALHRVEITSFHASQNLDLTSTFRKRGVIFKGETGANSTSGIMVVGLEVTIIPE